MDFFFFFPVAAASPLDDFAPDAPFIEKKGGVTSPCCFAVSAAGVASAKRRAGRSEEDSGKEVRGGRGWT